MKSFKNFLLYNNTIPIVFGVLFLGTTATFAASPDARESVYSSSTTLSSVDNSYIQDVDLETFPFAAYVISITEDDLYYYVSYGLDTIDLEDGVWQPLTQYETLQVSKDALGENDLGLLVTKELKDLRNAERRRLVETQEIEIMLGRSDKIITTEYSGLIGQVLDNDDEEFPDYDPVKTPPPAEKAPTPEKKKPTFKAVVDEKEVVIENSVPEETNRSGSGSGSEESNESENTASSTSATSTTPATEEVDIATSTSDTVTIEETADEAASPLVVEEDVSTENTNDETLDSVQAGSESEPAPEESVGEPEVIEETSAAAPVADDVDLAN